MELITTSNLASRSGRARVGANMAMMMIAVQTKESLGRSTIRSIDRCVCTFGGNQSGEEEEEEEEEGGKKRRGRLR